MPSSSTPSLSMSIEATLFELLWGYTTPVHVHLVSHLLHRGERYTTTAPSPPHHGGSLLPSSLSLPIPDRDEAVGLVLPLNQMMMMRRGEFHSDLDDDVSSIRLHREGEGFSHEIVRSALHHARQILFQAVASRCLVLDRTLRGICSSRAPSEERGTKLPMQPMVFLALRLELSTKSCHRSAEYGASRSTFRSQTSTAAAKRSSVVVRPRVVWAELMMEQEEQAEVRMLPQRKKEQNADDQQQQQPPPEVLAVCSKELWDAWGECTRHDWCWYMYQVAYSIACHERWLVALQQEEKEKKEEEEESTPHHNHHHPAAAAARGARPTWTSRPQINPFSSLTTPNSSKGIITGSEPVTAYLLRRTVRDGAGDDDDERSKKPAESRRMPTHESKHKGLQAAVPASGTTTHTTAAAAASRNNHHRAGGRGAGGNVPPPKKPVSANVVVVDVDAATTTLRNQSATSSITTNHATGRNHTAQNRGRILESRQRARRVKRTRSPFEEEGDDEEKKDSSEVVVLSD